MIQKLYAWLLPIEFKHLEDGWFYLGLNADGLLYWVRKGVGGLAVKVTNAETTAKGLAGVAFRARALEVYGGPIFPSPRFMGICGTKKSLNDG